MPNKTATIYHIASLAKVSPATVSRALNHPDQVSYSTRQHILDIAKELGFSKRIYRADSVSEAGNVTLKSFLICLPTFCNPFYGDIVEGATSAASNMGCNIFVSVYNITGLNIDAFLFMIKQHQIQGVILFSSISDSLLSRLQKTIPVVQCSEYNETYADVSVVSIDDAKAEEKATKYALSTGHTKVAFMTSSFQFHYSRRRMHGFAAAIEEAGLSIPKKWIVQLPRIDYSLAYDEALALLDSKEPPNAIIAASDVYAAACIKAAARLNIRIPEELSVIGFDNIDISTSTVPSITTIEQPRFQLGYTAFQVLLNEIEAPQEKKQRLFLPTELIIRESTGLQLPR